jgi:hypothetical protein
MKKTILALALFITCFSFGQIKVIETIPVIRLGSIGQNDMFIQHEGNEFTFFYKNIENEEAITSKSFAFKDLNNDFENLHEIIASGFVATPLLDIKLELPKDFVWLHYSTNLGRTFVQFMSKNIKNESTGVSKAFSIEEINKLFEKKPDVKKADATMSEFK